MFPDIASKYQLTSFRIFYLRLFHLVLDWYITATRIMSSLRAFRIATLHHFILVSLRFGCGRFYTSSLWLYFTRHISHWCYAENMISPTIIPPASQCLLAHTHRYQPRLRLALRYHLTQSRISHMPTICAWWALIIKDESSRFDADRPLSILSPTTLGR